MSIQSVGVVPSTAERQQSLQRPLPFCARRQTRPLDLEPKAAGGFVQTSGNVEGHHGVICCGSHPAPSEQLSLPSVGSEATLLDRYGSTAGATVDTGSLQQDLRLEAVRPRAAPPSQSLKAVKC